MKARQIIKDNGRNMKLKNELKKIIYIKKKKDKEKEKSERKIKKEVLINK